MKKVLCPNCLEAIDSFKHIGTEDNRVCPLCEKPIPVGAVLIAVQEFDEAHPQADK